MLPIHSLHVLDLRGAETKQSIHCPGLLKKRKLFSGLFQPISSRSNNNNISFI